MQYRQTPCKLRMGVFTKQERQEASNYTLRKADHIQTIHANSNLYYKSFFPSTIRAWNSLSDEIKSAPNVAAFKYCLNENLRKPPRYFSCGMRMGHVLHARFRLECSLLNSHLYRKNIIESPSCSCGGFESNYIVPLHFFLP